MYVTGIVRDAVVDTGRSSILLPRPPGPLDHFWFSGQVSITDHFRPKQKQSKASKEIRRIRWCFTHQLEKGIETDDLAMDAEAEYLMGQILDHTNCFVFQVEMSPTTGQPHFQGYFELNTKNRLSWIKNNLFSFHYLSAAKGTPKQNLAYCTKTESCIRGPWQVGEFRLSAETNKTEEFVKSVASGKKDEELLSEFPSLFLRHHQQVGMIRAIKHVQPPTRFELYGDNDVEIYVFFGEPGTGKSHSARRLYPNIYDVPIQRKGNFWLTDAAELAPVILIEDFDGNMPLKNLNRLLDPYPLQMEKKGGYVYWCPKIVILTTNTPPHLWYPSDNRQNVLRQVYRRITCVFDFNTPEGKAMTTGISCDDLEARFNAQPSPPGTVLQRAANKRMSSIFLKASPAKKAKADSTKLYNPVDHGVVIKKESIFIDLTQDTIRDSDLSFSEISTIDVVAPPNATELFDAHNRDEDAEIDAEYARCNQDCIYCFNRYCTCFDESVILIDESHDSIEDSDLD